MGKKMKKLLGVAVTLLVSIYGAQAWAAPITYNINLTNGSSLISGMITTDGTLGDLVVSNFLSWNFSVDVNAHTLQFNASSADSGAEVVCRFAGCALAATSSGLLIQSSIPGESQVYFGIDITAPGVHDYKYESPRDF